MSTMQQEVGSQKCKGQNENSVQILVHSYQKVNCVNEGTRIEHELGNNVADSNREFENEKNFCKDDALNLERSEKKRVGFGFQFYPVV